MSKPCCLEAIELLNGRAREIDVTLVALFRW